MATTDEIRPQGVSGAQEALQSLLKAKKNLRLYPSNNPVYRQIVDNTYGKFRDFLDSGGALELGIARNDIFLGEESVYHGDGKDDNLALFFFRDGLRSLGFDSALEKEELEKFLRIISVDFDNELVEDDIITLLWEKDFRNIRYTVDDNALAEYDDYETDAARQAKDGASEEDNIQYAYEEALGMDDAEVVPQMPIAEEDLRALALEVQKDAGAKVDKLSDILLDMLYMAESVEEFKDVARILNNAVEFSVRHSSLGAAASVFRRVREMINSTRSDELKKALGAVFFGAGTPALVKLIGEQLDSKEGIKEEDFREYVKPLGVNAIPPFMEILGELKTISGRRSAIGALAYLGRNDISALLKGLRDDRWYVVRNIIHVLRLVGNKAAVEYLARVAGHQEPRVRREAMKTVGELGGPLAARTVKLYLDDPDRAVRSAAVRALGSIGTDQAREALLERLADRRVLNAEFPEVKESFEVLCHWRSDDVFEFLMVVLRKSPFFGRAKFNEYKAAAVHALGLLGRRDALGEIVKLRGSKDRLVSEYAEVALKRINDAGR
jgi:HEAT repeat protein